ncbi:AAA family ATPase [Myxococcus sp. K15C18031901]|uniref:ATP-binding protein n=1 Tax=Myxococcus dinghuensis TaxID=2906761 RepID=UPI0020A7379D|nr:AAA family ATPase [Myxococcus dinghuensis]MCP3098067.1 AAA family ATPase [Myxococcus dinghuensis]
MSTDARLSVFLDDDGEVFSGVQQGQYLWQPDPFDVETLNAPARRAFHRLLTRASAATPPGSGKLLLLLGESGSGKTHLVRAFRNHAHGQRKGFVGYMPMTVDESNYDRYVLNNLITSLEQPYDLSVDDDSGLMRLSDALMEHCRSAFAPLIPDEKVLEEDELHGTIHSVADELLADPRFRSVEVDLLRALLYLQRKDPRINRQVFHWLRCEERSASDRKLIGDLVPRRGDDAHSRMVEQLGRVMDALGHALVVCVDQVEDLSDFEQRPQMETSFRRAMASLISITNKVRRAVVVVCCLSDYWVKMRPQLLLPMIDRIENDPEPVTLERTVTADIARDIAVRRLRALYEPRGATFDPADPTYPFPTAGFEALSGQRPRDVLNTCRRYRDRAIQDQRLPAEFPLPEAHPIQGKTPPVRPPVLEDVEQEWTNFRARFSPILPEEPADITALLAWAVEVSGDELGGTQRFTAKKRDDEVLDVGIQPQGEKLVVALCEMDPRGGGLARQLQRAIKAAAGSTPVIIRTSEFPATTGTKVAEQIALLFKKGGRRVVVGDSELRDLVTLREFRTLNEGKPSFREWSQTLRPVSRMKAVGDMLGLHLRSGATPSAPRLPPPAPVPVAKPTGRASTSQSTLFNDAQVSVPNSGKKTSKTTPSHRDGATSSTTTRGTTSAGLSQPSAGATDAGEFRLTAVSAILTSSHSDKPASRPGGFEPQGVASNGTSPPSASPTGHPGLPRDGSPPSASPRGGPAAHRAGMPPPSTEELAMDGLRFDDVTGAELLPLERGANRESDAKVPGLRPRVPTPPKVTPVPRAALTGPVRLGVTEGIRSQPVFVEPLELTRHSAFLGGSGSGKTTLALNMLEQLLLRGIPVILVDRKGDLAAYARAEAWDEPLEDAALLERRRLLKERVDVALYTPGRSDGRPLAIPVVPHGLEALPVEEQEQGVQQAADAIAGMLDYKSSPNDKAARALLAQALRLLVQQPLDRELTLEVVQQFVASQDPALIQEAGGLSAKTYDKLAMDLEVLRLNLRSLLSSGGERLDLDELLGRGASAVPGRTRLSIISTKFLGDNNRILFWVSQLLLETHRWASQHPSSQLQAVLLFDEADVYLPATSKPATKEPMESLLKRARSAGVGIMLATQSPGDLDYKCRENVLTWSVGKIKEDNALKKLRPLFSDARVDADARLPSQKQGQFHVLRDGKVEQLKADRSVIRTAQLSEDEILRLARAARPPKPGGAR